MRKQEVDSLRGPLIINSKDKTLDLGNWYIKRNLCTHSLIWTWFLGCRCMQPSSWNAVNVGFVSSNAKGFESRKLCNAHDILSYFGDLNCFLFSFTPILCEKNIDWLSWSRWNLMTSDQFERIYTTKATLGFKRILRTLHEQLTSDVPYYHNCLWAFSIGSWSDEFSSQRSKGETSSILLYILFFYNHRCVRVPFQNPNLKAN